MGFDGTSNLGGLREAIHEGVRRKGIYLFFLAFFFCILGSKVIKSIYYVFNGIMIFNVLGFKNINSNDIIILPIIFRAEGLNS